MEYFLKNPEQCLKRAVLLSYVWGADAEVEEGNLDNYIYFLRRRLRTLKTKAKITTVHGVGYKLEAEEESWNVPETSEKTDLLLFYDLRDHSGRHPSGLLFLYERSCGVQESGSVFQSVPESFSTSSSPCPFSPTNGWPRWKPVTV